MPSNYFYEKLNNISKDLGMNPRDLLLVMFFESGIDPSATNKNGGAAGLIQFMPQTLKDMGVNPKGFNRKSSEEQLNYVKRFIEGKKNVIGGKPFTSATQYYHANFYPATLVRWNGSDPFKNRNVVVVDGNSPSRQERNAYKANRVLDTNNDGIISVGDLTRTMLKAERSSQFRTALAQLNSVAGQGKISERYFKKNPMPTQQENNNINNSLMSSILDKIETFLSGVMKLASNKENKYLICVDSDNDFSSKLEYARVLKYALKEELNINSEIYSSKNDINIECSSLDNEDVIREVCDAVSETFKFATKKIGGINIIASVIPNMQSNYKLINIKVADINYRKFHSKFIKG